MVVIPEYLHVTCCDILFTSCKGIFGSSEGQIAWSLRLVAASCSRSYGLRLVRSVVGCLSLIYFGEDVKVLGIDSVTEPDVVLLHYYSNRTILNEIILSQHQAYIKYRAIIKIYV